LYWYAHGKPWVSQHVVVKRMIESTSSASNKYGVVDDNSNPYKYMIMNVMKMNQYYVGQYSTIDEEPNADASKFFDFLKDSS